MSYFKKSKRNITLKSTLLTFSGTVCAIAYLSGTAYADPEKKVEDAVEAPVEMPVNATDEAADQAKDMAIDAAKDAVIAPMDLPQVEDDVNDAEQTEPEIMNTPAVNVPQTTVEPPVWETPAAKEPAGSIIPVPGATLDIAQSCYPQEGGVLECICEGDTACAELTSSDICEPGTSWRNDEGFGGCAKKAE